MAYFPFMVELADLRGLIVGAGSVAYEKAVRISEFGSKLRVVAPIVDERFSKLSNVEIARGCRHGARGHFLRRRDAETP